MRIGTGFGRLNQARKRANVMKSRRFTALCVALVALAGTPRALQEGGRLLAIIQHKAQVKFWSMVLEPKATAESADTQLLATARPLARPITLESNCPLQAAESQVTQQARSNSRAGLKADTVSRPKAGTRQQMVSAPSSPAGLMAANGKALFERSRAPQPQLRHLKRLPAHPPVAITETVPATLALQKAAVESLPTAAGRPDTFRFVMAPAVNPVASVLVEKENIIQLKMLRKSFEDSKQPRHKEKGRLPIGRGVPSYVPAN
jgi:hypothetical protein